MKNKEKIEEIGHAIRDVYGKRFMQLDPMGKAVIVSEEYIAGVSSL